MENSKFVRNEKNTPIEGTPDYTIKGYIKVFDDKYQTYVIGEMIYEHFWNEEFQYIFKPYWNKIDWLMRTNLRINVDVPSYDMDLRLEKYYRVNTVPAFITSRVPPKNRQDIRELLDEVGMSNYDEFEYLLKCPYRFTDNIIVRSDDTENIVSFKSIGVK